MRRFALRRVIPTGALVVLAHVASVAGAVSLRYWAERFDGPLLLVLLIPLVLLSTGALLWLSGRSGLRTTAKMGGMVIVGADGVLVETTRRRRFVSYSQITEVRAQGVDRVRLRLIDGTTLMLGCDDSEDLETCIDGARQTFHTATPVAPGLLTSASSSEEEQLTYAAELITDGSFRERPVSAEEIARVAVNPKGAPADRVLATCALEKANDVTRAKLRVAVEDTAEPALRDALREALDGETTPRRLKSLRGGSAAKR